MRKHIYALVDPRDGSIKYVGCTKNVKSRMLQIDAEQAGRAAEHHEDHRAGCYKCLSAELEKASKAVDGAREAIDLAWRGVKP